jgi:pyrroline-5-carboxylate reductase
MILEAVITIKVVLWIVVIATPPTLIYQTVARLTAVAVMLQGAVIVAVAAGVSLWRGVNWAMPQKCDVSFKEVLSRIMALTLVGYVFG